MSSFNTRGSSSHSSLRGTSTIGETRQLFAPSKTLVARKIVYDYTAHLFLCSPLWKSYTIIIEILRFAQFLLPCFIIKSPILYQSIITKYFGYISNIFTNLIPTEFINGYFIPYSLIYISIFIIIVAMYSITSYFFTRKYKVKHFLDSILHFIAIGPWVIMHNFMISTLGHTIGYEFIEKGNFKNAYLWLVITVVLFFYCIFVYLHHTVTNVSLAFVNTSIPSYLPHLQTYIIHFTALLCFISNLIPHVPLVAQIVLISIMILIYSSIFALLTKYCRLIYDRNTVVFFAFSTDAIFILIQNMVLIILKKEIPFILYGIECVFMFLLFPLYVVINKRMNLKMLEKLDHIAIAPEAYYVYIRSVMDVVIYSSIAFRFAHPSLRNWKIFRLASENYPFSSYIWITWARFAACDPDENQTLLWISDQLQKLVYHSGDVMNIRAQISFLNKYREDSLMHQLKRRIGECNKLMSSAQSAYRNFWNCVYQGNIRDVEISALSAAKLSDKARRELEALVEAYPNNQHTVGAYCRYLHSTSKNQCLYREWNEKRRKLKNGFRISPDAAQIAACRMFPALASSPSMKKASVGFIGLSSTESLDLADSSSVVASSPMADEGGGEEIGETLAKAISQMHNSVIEGVMIAFVVLFLLYFALAQPVMISLYSQSEGSFKTAVYGAAEASHLSNTIARIMVCVNRWMAILAGVEDLSLLAGVKGVVVNETQKMIAASIADSEKEINNLRDLLDTIEFQFVFEDFINLSVAFGDRNANQYTLEAALLQIAMIAKTAEEVSTEEEASSFVATDNVFRLAQFVLGIQDHLYGVAEALHRAARKIRRKNEVLCLISIGICVALTVVAYPILIVVLTTGITRDILSICRCYLMLPKHEVRNIADSFRRESRVIMKNKNNNNDELDTKNQQGENIIMTLSATNSSLVAFYWPLISFIACLILMIGCALTQCLVAAVGFEDWSDKYTSIVMVGSRAIDIHSELANSLAFSYWIGLIDNGLPVNEMPTLEQSLVLMRSTAKRSSKYLHHILFGESDEEIRTERLQILSLASDFFMFPEWDMNFTGVDSLVDVFQLQPPVGVIFLVYGAIQTLIVNIPRPQKVRESPVIFHFLETELYENYFSKVISSLETDSEGGGSFTIQQAKDFSKILSRTLSIYVAIITIFALSVYFLSIFRAQILSLLHPILHCPPETVIKNKMIMNVLNGGKVEDQTRHNMDDDNLYLSIVNKMCDAAVLITDASLNITKTNEAASKVLMKEKLVGENLRSVLKEADAFSTSNTDFYNDFEDAAVGRSAFNFRRTVTVQFKDNSIHHLNISVSAHTGKGYVEDTIDSSISIASYIITITDNTTEVEMEMALDRASQNLQSLLASIIPAQMIAPYKRWSAGELSFSVSAATIVSISLEEFAELEELQPSTVFAVLNKARKEIESALDAHPTLTRIRSSGTRFMAGGGLFGSAGVSPEMHAKECVRFALDVRSRIKQLCGEFEVEIPARIGINTGGPVVAGIYRVGCPVFEVFGQAVSTAEQIEAVADPLTVLISRHVYELTFGPSFTVRDAGQRELKDGTVETFIVEK